MKNTKLILLLLTLLFLACNEKKNNKNVISVKTNETVSTSINDSIELESLTKELYKWTETKSSQIDFDPLQLEKTDTIYSGINLDRHKQRQDELSATDFFAQEFLSNYSKIALTIDKKLKSKTLTYNIGDIPPYGNDANPWCNCQDYPDNYWEKIKLENIIINDDKATFNWTWGEKFKYNVKAIKVNNKWKVSYLEGFDFDDFLNIKD